MAVTGPKFSSRVDDLRTVVRASMANWIMLGSDSAHCSQYQRLALEPDQVDGILVEDLAAAALLGVPAHPAGASALVYGSSEHPRVARFCELYANVVPLMPALRSRLRQARLTTVDDVTAAALRSAGAATVLQVARRRGQGRGITRAVGVTEVCGIAVFGATTVWRARAVKQALVATFTAARLTTAFRAYVDDFGMGGAPRGWTHLVPLSVGDPVALALFVDGGHFADQYERARTLYESGATVYTTGLGLYGGESAWSVIEGRPGYLFDSVVDVVASYLDRT